MLEQFLNHIDRFKLCNKSDVVLLAVSVYYILSDEEKSAMGVNRIICSNITIRFKEGKVNNLSFYTQPEARFIPPHEIKPEDIKLPGFIWKESEKPVKSDAKKKQPATRAFPSPVKELR